MSAYQEGDRVRVVKPDAPAGLYEIGSTGTVVNDSSGRALVQWDHSGKTAMVFDNEVERIYEESDETQDDGPGELTVWDRYAIAVLPAVIVGKPSCDNVMVATAQIVNQMMELRRGKAS